VFFLFFAPDAGQSQADVFHFKRIQPRIGVFIIKGSGVFVGCRREFSVTLSSKF